MSERINTPYTSEHFVAFCLSMLGQPYWYGTVVYKCSESLRSRKAKQYPSHYKDSRTARYKQDIANKKVCDDCVGLIKKSHPQIRLILILPYLNSSMITDGYDETLYPPLESVPRRFAISRRNEWMVLESDAVVAYVTHGWGGAAKTLEYARRKKKSILLYGAAQEERQ